MIDVCKSVCEWIQRAKQAEIDAYCNNARVSREGQSAVKTVDIDVLGNIWQWMAWGATADLRVIEGWLNMVLIGL